jgi:hypothetical protein
MMDIHDFNNNEKWMIVGDDQESKKLGNKNFSIDDLNKFANFLNSFSVFYFRHRFGNSSSDTLKKTVKSVNILVRELYDRDCKKKFTQTKDFWVINMDSNNIDEIAREIPHVLTFPKRLERLRIKIAEDMENHIREPVYDQMNGNSTRIISIRRNYELEDAFDKLKKIDMKNHLVIKYLDEYGNEEVGIDGGGLLKEFITQVSR